MAERKPYFGKDTVLFFRQLSKAETIEGARLAYQIEHTLNEERSNETIETKDGQIVTAGPLTTTIDITAVSSNDDVNKTIYDAFKNDELLECWEVNLKDPGTTENKFKAKYMVGKIGSWSLPASVTGTRDITTTFTVERGPVDGEVTLTQEQQDSIATVFRDLDKYTETP